MHMFPFYSIVVAYELFICLMSQQQSVSWFPHPTYAAAF